MLNRIKSFIKLNLIKNTNQDVRSPHEHILSLFPGKETSILDLANSTDDNFEFDTFVYSTLFTVEYQSEMNGSGTETDSINRNKYLEPIEQAILIPIISIREKNNDQKSNILNNISSETPNKLDVNNCPINYLPIFNPLDKNVLNYTIQGREIIFQSSEGHILSLELTELTSEILKKCGAVTILQHSNSHQYIFSVSKRNGEPSVATIKHNKNPDSDQIQDAIHRKPSTLSSLFIDHFKLDTVWREISHGISGGNVPSFFLFRIKKHSRSLATINRHSKCIICTNAFKNGHKSSKEHIIPAWLISLSGVDSYTASFICVSCNNSLGDEIESSVRLLIFDEDDSRKTTTPPVVPWILKIKQQVDSLTKEELLFAGHRDLCLYGPTRLPKLDQIFVERIKAETDDFSTIRTRVADFKIMERVADKTTLIFWFFKTAVFFTIASGAHTNEYYLSCLRNKQLPNELYIYFSHSVTTPDNQIDSGITYFTKDQVTAGHFFSTHFTPYFSFIVSSKPLSNIAANGFAELFPEVRYACPPLKFPETIENDSGEFSSLLFHKFLLDKTFDTQMVIGQTFGFRN